MRKIMNNVIMYNINNTNPWFSGLGTFILREMDRGLVVIINKSEDSISNAPTKYFSGLLKTHTANSKIRIKGENTKISNLEDIN